MDYADPFPTFILLSPPVGSFIFSSVLNPKVTSRLAVNFFSGSSLDNLPRLLSCVSSYLKATNVPLSSQIEPVYTKHAVSPLTLRRGSRLEFPDLGNSLVNLSLVFRLGCPFQRTLLMLFGAPKSVSSSVSVS